MAGTKKAVKNRARKTVRKGTRKRKSATSSASGEFESAPPDLEALFREMMEAVKKRRETAETVAMPPTCGKCEYGFIIENGRARRCGCRIRGGIGNRQEALDEFLARHRVGMPRRLQKVSEFTYLVRPGREKIKTFLTNYVKELGQGKRYGLYIYGPPGVGKSFAAAYVVNSVKFARIMPAAMVNFARMLSALRNTFHDPLEHQKLLSVMYEVPLLVFDDVGMEQKVSENPEFSWGVAEFYKVIDFRRDEELPTIITTNRTMEELEERMGEAVMKRIEDMTVRLDMA